MGLRRTIVAISFVVAVALSQFSAFAQNWDGILDRYETICTECLRMRGIVDAGGRVSRRKISGLMAEISSLKKMMEDTGNSMTDQQRERFESIKSQYSGGVGVQTASVAVQPDVRTVAEKVPPVSVEPQVSDTASYCRNIGEVPQVEVPSAACIRTVTSSLPDEGSCVTEEFKKIGSSVTGRHRFDKLILAHCGVWPEISVGGMFSLVHSDSGWGGYISARSNFRNVIPAFEYSSADASGTQLFTGKVRSARGELSAGAVYSPCSWSAIYAGAGYGGFNYYWETADLKWARISNCCFSGFSLDCGVIFSFGMFSVGAGASTTAFKYSDLTVSLGVKF